jgi:hypothetical protein
VAPCSNPPAQPLPIPLAAAETSPSMDHPSGPFRHMQQLLHTAPRQRRCR